MSESQTSKRINLYDLTRKEIIALLDEWGFSEYYGELVWRYQYRQRVLLIDKMVDLTPDLRQRLLAEAELTGLTTIREMTSQDKSSSKYLLALADGQTIETVLMQYSGRSTVCVSTQVGCAMGCVFCATGQMGFVRNLQPGEIVAQVLLAMRELDIKGQNLRNVVLMGMGEPLHNYEATMTAIEILTDEIGLAIGPRYITLSTVGLPSAIRRMADEARPVNLAVSLHAATNRERNKLIPINQRWSLDELMDACRYYVAKRKRRIFVEWALIFGQNDTVDQAHGLGRLMSGLDVHINLIPLNPTEGYGGQPSDNETARRFQAILTEYGLPSTVRQRRGIEITAGCGQLRSPKVS